MNLKIGQGILGRYKFKDGVMPSKNRTYLVVTISSTHIGLLNVSSSAGKEHKLQMATNESIKVFEPPFKKPSFVKLDSYIEVPISHMRNAIILHSGETLNRGDLDNILLKLQKYI